MKEPLTGAATCPQCGGPLRATGAKHGMCPRCAWWAVEGGDVTGDDLMALPGLRVMSEIARGGMGVVYRAIEAEAGRDVAVKMMPPTLADTPEVRERFAQEARAMGALDHPGILPVYRVGEHRGLPFFSMKLAEGGTLAQHLKRYANDWRGIVTLMAGIAEAVHHAHQRGLLHRDLKPANILFDAAGRAYVSDFGLVKMAGVDSSLTRSVSVLGTPHYMAPEVAESDARAASVASDVWSLGAILYELIAQHLAFQAEGVPALLRKIVDESPTPLPSAVPRDLATITLKCLQKVAARRYASAGDLAEDLRRWLRGEPVTARRLPMSLRLVYWARRRPALAAMSVLLAVSLLGGALLIFEKNRELKSTLRTSLLNEAHAIRVGARVQQCESGLAAVSKAARLGSSPELEEEAASLLALPSMKLVEKIKDVRQWQNLIPDADLKNAADFRHEDGVRVVELLTGRELAKLPVGLPSLSMREAFSNDGRLLLYDSRSKDRLFVCEWRSGRILREIAWKNSGTARFSPDSQTLAVGRRDGSIEFYDLHDTSKAPLIWPPDKLAVAKPMSFSPDGQWLAVADETHLVEIRDVKTGSVRSTFGVAGESHVLSGSWFANSRGMMLGMDHGMVRSWSMDGGPSRLLPGHSAQVYGAALQPQGQLAVSSGFEGSSWIIDWPSGRVMGMEPGTSTLTRFSLDGSRLAIYEGGQGSLKLYDVASSSVCRQFVSPDVVAGKYVKRGSWCALVRPKGGRLVASVDYGSTELYDLATARYLGALPDGGNTLAWTADGSELWTRQGTALVRWRFEDQADGSIVARPAKRLDLSGHIGLRLALAEKADRWAMTVGNGIFTGSISKNDSAFIPTPQEMKVKSNLNPVTLSPDGRWAMIASDAEEGLGILDLNERRCVKIIHCNPSAYVAFSPDSQTAWVGTWSELWQVDMRRLEVVKKLSDHSEPSSFGFIDMTADGRLLATLDGMTVTLRQGATGEPFLRLRHPMPLNAGWMSLTPDGRYLTFSGMGRVLQVWDLFRLAAEMKKLGVPWRGPDLGDANVERPVTSLRIER